MIESQSIITRNQDILSSSVNNETVMMDVESGQYIGLDPIATRIWELLQNPMPFEKLCQTLTQEYDTNLEQCKQDVATFLKQSQQANLITIDDTSA